jgi:hypothetical protein
VAGFSFLFTRCPARILARTPTILTEGFCAFLQSLQATTWIVPWNRRRVLHQDFFAVQSPQSSSHIILREVTAAVEKALLNTLRSIKRFHTHGNHTWDTQDCVYHCWFTLWLFSNVVSTAADNNAEKRLEDGNESLVRICQEAVVAYLNIIFWHSLEETEVNDAKPQWEKTATKI